MFLTTLIVGSLITVSSNSWMGMWIGLEINLLSIIPLLSANEQTNSAEASIKYFITQMIASNIILMAIICMFYFNEQIYGNFNLTMMMQSALFIKMGAAPFHAWFPEVMEGLSWFNCLLILTWQKIAPMLILMTLIKQEIFVYLVILSSSMIGSIMGFNQLSLRKIMSYSSINHIGWMIAAMINAKSIWMIYFLVYSLITINIVLIFSSMKVKNIAQISSLFKINKLSSLMFSMNFFSLGGLPPFLGFLPKWLTIQQMVYAENYFIALMMILLTMIAMFFYLRLALVPMTLMNSITLIKFSTTTNFIIYFSNIISLMALLTAGVLLNPF
uniref:NADH-ubiquinone oxidoreductase chain 2 n=1 Tax=Cryptocephalus vittatus TaxID=1425562 RepID=A0A343C2H8_9CUCU|nr:NADH dehydrogenase subunit 2 [Cryptocephalus vittatus]